MNPALAEVSPHGPPLLTAPRRELVVCTQVALSWTASRLDSDRQDVVTLYSAPFRDILGATVRHRRKGVVEVWVEEGPTLSFRVTRDAADALQAHIDQAAQSQESAAPRTNPRAQEPTGRLKPQRFRVAGHRAGGHPGGGILS
jgi:hypothetical protein